MGLISLKSRQVKKLKDDSVVEIYHELKRKEIDWADVFEDDGPNSIMTVCRRHEKKIQELSALNIKMKRHRTLESALPDNGLE